MTAHEVLAVVAAVVTVSAAAAPQNPRVIFSTVGPDVYADGTTVLDGERYALVWAEPGVEEVVFMADGSTSGGVMVSALDGGSNGKCETCQYEIDAAKMSEYEGGTWFVYMLDTRQWDADGNVSLCLGLGVVNAAGKVPESQVFPRMLTAVRAEDCPAATAATPSAVPEGTANPVVADIRIDGAEVCVSATSTVPYIQYTLLSADAPDADKFEPAGSAPQTGAADLEGALEFRLPLSESGKAFFKVGRR